jgi:hypothetical protein
MWSGSSLEVIRSIPKWQVIDHACAQCLGRLLMRQVGNLLEYRCSECDATGSGSHESLCWCGVEVKNHGKVFECVLNDHKSPTLLNQVLVAERRVEKAAVEPRQIRTANARESCFFD